VSCVDSSSQTYGSNTNPCLSRRSQRQRRQRQARAAPLSQTQYSSPFQRVISKEI